MTSNQSDITLALNTASHHDYEKVSNISRHEGGLERHLIELQGEKFKKYRENWHKASNREVLTDFPQFVLLETLYQCNLKCVMCYKHDDIKSDELDYTETLPVEVVERVIDECAEHGCPSISFNNNNEPLLDKKIYQKIAYASKKGILDTMINTNALLLGEEQSRALIEAGLTRLLVSIDAATEKTFGAQRLTTKKQASQDFKKIVRNTEKFLEIREKMGRKLPVLRASFVVTRVNESEREQFIDYWIDKADEITFQRYTAPALTEHFLSLYPKNRDEMLFECNQPFERLIVRGDGNVYPCCYQTMNHPIGSIYNNTLHEIWHGKKMQEYQRIVIDRDWDANENCKTCSSAR